jgi:hypothetical protein
MHRVFVLWRVEYCRRRRQVLAVTQSRSVAIVSLFVRVPSQTISLYSLERAQRTYMMHKILFTAGRILPNGVTNV